MIFPGEVLVLFVGFAIYSGMRLERLDEIWAEIDSYRESLQMQFAVYISDSFIVPYMDMMTSGFIDVMDLDAIVGPVFQNMLGGETESSTEWDELMSGSEPTSVFAEQVEEMFVQSGMGSWLEEAREQIDQDELEGIDGGSNSSDDADVDADPEFLARFLVHQELMDPDEVFRKSKNFYRKYKWANRVFTGIQLTLTIQTITLLTITAFSIVDNPMVESHLLPLLIVVLGAWIILEVLLWIILSNEIKMSDRTIMGKFLKPNPGNLIS